MNDITFSPLHSYKMKYAGISISALSLLLLLINTLFNNLSIFNTLSITEHQELFFWTFVFGLFTIVFSKEKIDDDRVRKIRSRALQVSYGFLTAILLVICLNSFYMEAFEAIKKIYILSLVATSLIIYLIIFNLGLFFDSSIIYSENSAGENIRKNKIFFLIYLVVSTALLALILFL
ncbi:MAG: hypothetical protein JEZ03_10080 [Bacteroidales bacterium]|nr:hypothetical protein [Bacteroidales bacterium]